MATVGLLTMSDGRDYIAPGLDEYCRRSEDALVAMLEAAEHKVVRADTVLTTNRLATTEARRVADARPDLTIFNYPVWAFPHFTMLAAESTPGPLLLIASIDPQQPGMVGMLAAGGALDQIGRKHTRAWGDVNDPAVSKRILDQIAAGHAVSALRGNTFGRFGGRPMGMYTAVANTDQWMSVFGVDVEEIDQWEIVLRAEKVEDTRAKQGVAWLEKNAAGVHYDGDRLTPELLERQVRSYYAMRELIDEWNLDFSGIKGQPELTSHFVTMDVTEAFLNDPYDWDGPKATHVTSTEADMDGALTMQILKHLSGQPVLFADVRHYHADRDIWDLANSGQHATWYAARSDDPAENLRQVNLYPEVFFFPAGGASVHHYAAPGAATFARLTRDSGRYRMQVSRGAFERYDDATNETLGRQSTFEWPHAFTRLDAPADTFLARFGANHIHAVPGDYVSALESVCTLLDIDFQYLGTTAAR
jgi:L-fucose/D-arabinose isomerase